MGSLGLAHNLAGQEGEEIAIIEGFSPKPLSEAEAQQAIAVAIAETAASFHQEMGKIIGALKGKYGAGWILRKQASLSEESLGRESLLQNLLVS